ncbi:MAG: adenine phosphoribosyltransferase [Verrucomicrobiota bacterium]|nr:adenine phosphoribosyltransferase [Verrucomicrobiales bacterium]MEC9036083.1 adenine phosphoribosyltransferase [Verrucomicrobiota bacterium]MED5471410.1 adenine phosphoribosyltransferase [Verrucomicrobiota bacterium]MEE2966735.1 adenine phosphoribosyltransferase [Verrucomicrobiota bacterium]HAA87348.1 adenine phosphoribosyltransferase [Verrucomicrobiales bacterium]|tara:strand:+ start:761 stop:1291 length:531 start_codon:yes stop_codon:yes gene_type:complete
MKNIDLNKLEKAIRDVPDFPKPGILFKDITPVLADAELFQMSIQAMASATNGARIDKIVGIDARGFIFGAAIANLLGVGFVPVRKAGKLPWITESESYSLEYGKSVIEIHKDAISPSETVIIVDDLLATGGTAEATLKLVEKLGANIHSACFFIELSFLNGKEKLGHTKVESLLVY